MLNKAINSPSGALMKKGSLFTLVLLAISFLLPLTCAYSSYDILVEADFLSHGVTYEDMDKETLLLDKQNVLGIVLHPFSSVTSLKNNIVSPFFYLPLSGPRKPQVSALRC